MEKCDLLQCVDLGLDAFGINMKQAAYSALEIDENLTRCEMLSEPEAFVRALQTVFGSGYVFAERSIIIEVKKKFGLDFPASSYSIPEAFGIAHRQIRKLSHASG
jgi:hypothetical protein